MKPLEDARISHRGWRIITLENFQNYTPNRLELNFDHPEDYSDQFYEVEFSRLFLAILSFLHKNFSDEERPREWVDASWSVFHDQFLQHAAAVAQPDGVLDDWEGILRNETERNFLLAAVWIKTLESKVFSQLLLGADERQERILREQDLGLIGSEGE